MKSKWVILLVLLLVGAPAAMQAQFAYTTNADNNLTITGYSGPAGAVTIPTNINGLGVTGVGNGSIVFSAGVTSVIIPGGISSIGDDAFNGCDSLTNVTLLSGVTSIGTGAFESCSGLTNVAIPSSVTNIGEGTGSGLDAGAFENCVNLTAITVDPQNSFYSSTNGVLFNKNQTTLLEYPAGLVGSYTIPDSVTNIGIDAFPGTILTSITIPGSVTSIGAMTFTYCGSLTSVTIACGVTNIGNGAFKSCFSLTSVTIPNSVTSIGIDAFQQCIRLGSMIIPGSVTNIGSDAFEANASFSNAYFVGNAPAVGSFVFNNGETAYYLPGTIGWNSSLSDIPAVLWNPLIQVAEGSLGVNNNRLGFTITGTPNIPVTVEACTNLANPVWIPLQTLTLTNGSAYFSDPGWTNYPCRFYGIGFP